MTQCNLQENMTKSLQLISLRKNRGKFIRPRRHKTSSNQNAIFIGYDTLDLMFFEYAYETRTPNLYDHTGLLGLTIMKLSSVSFVFVLLKCPIRALHPIKHPIRTWHPIKHPIRTLHPICIAFWLKVCGLWVPNFILERVL